MAFQRTLRAVQAARASSTIFSCVSIVLFAFCIKLRRDASAQFLQELHEAHPDIFDIAEPSHGTWGSVALLGLALSVAWNSFCFFDLMLKKHYRFDRRICVFVDLLIALVLAVTGFLNFAYDAIVYFALDLASGAQVRLEVAAIVLLTLATIGHVAFFCYGCKDPAAAAMNFEHVPLEAHTPAAPSAADDYDMRPMRSHAGSMGTSDGGLVEIDLGKKVQMFRLPIKIQQREVATKDHGMRTPPRTPREDDHHKHLGFVGAPAQLVTPNLNHDAAVDSEEQSFLKAHAASEWI